MAPILSLLINTLLECSSSDTYNIPHSLTALRNLQYPNNTVPVFGDANRGTRASNSSYEMALQLAILNRNEKQIKQFSDFLASRIAKGKYDRSKLGSRKYGAGAYRTPLQLLWGLADIDGDATIDTDPPRPRSNHLRHAGLTIQRNISETDPVTNSLMAVIIGGSYIHSHASGMSIGLYGQGYVLGTDGGRGTYGTPPHENYYRLFAAHNAVISNGGSASRGGWANLGIDRVQPVALEPEAGQPGVSSNHSFATTRFSDKHNLVAPAEHQRTVALIRLNDEHGYYLDVFRAKSDRPSGGISSSSSEQDETGSLTINHPVSKEYHDYVYHNVADRLEITLNGKALAMQATPDRYRAF